MIDEMKLIADMKNTFDMQDLYLPCHFEKLVNNQQKVGEWISCKERLPEDMQKCLCTSRIYFIPDHVGDIDNYIGLELNTYSKKYGWFANQNVIAWQPLPDPYMESEE